MCRDFHFSNVEIATFQSLTDPVSSCLGARNAKNPPCPEGLELTQSGFAGVSLALTGKLQMRGR
jgi:hypothetical protein